MRLKGLAELAGFNALDDDWQARGACNGAPLEMFFPTRGNSVSEAKAVCASCPVQQECLDFALAMGEKWGIWGGLSERQRRQIRKGKPVYRTCRACRKAGMMDARRLTCSDECADQVRSWSVQRYDTNEVIR